MINEELHLSKHLEDLNINEDQVLLSSQSVENLNIDERRALKFRKINDLLVHISQCWAPCCQNPYCDKAKGLIRHGVVCQTRAAGGCHLCKKMWHILDLHAIACKKSNCKVPHCRSLKDSQQEAAELADSLNFKGTPEQVRKGLDLLVHSSRCPSPCCLYPNCGKVKDLFHHGVMCKARAVGGCHLCKMMWHTLQLHALACKESNCNVPRCSDLKAYHLLHLDSQQEAAANVA